jgi:hypothetical protein
LRGAQATKAIHRSFAALWIASLSLSSGAHSRDPLARNDVEGTAGWAKRSVPSNIKQENGGHGASAPLPALRIPAMLRVHFAGTE